MPNVTISVPDELKTEMDKLTEVNWSEVCRNAISLYISQRKSPVPKIELSLDQIALEYDNFQTGYPTLRIDLKLHNKMDSEIIVDRIIVNARSYKDSNTFPLGISYDLHKRTISSNSTSHAQIYLVILKEKITSLAGIFDSSFYCQIHFAVYAEGFKNVYDQDLTTKIPIDEWKEVVAKAVKTHQTTRVDR